MGAGGRRRVEARHDRGPRRLEVARRACGRGRRCVQAVRIDGAGRVRRCDVVELPRRAKLSPVHEQAVHRPAGERGQSGNGMLISRGLQIGRDPTVAENVEQVLAHARVDVANHGVLGREQPVVPPSVACAPAGHVSSSPDLWHLPRPSRSASCHRVDHIGHLHPGAYAAIIAPRRASAAVHREKRSPHES